MDQILVGGSKKVCLWFRDLLVRIEPLQDEDKYTEAKRQRQVQMAKIHQRIGEACLRKSGRDLNSLF